MFCTTIIPTIGRSELARAVESVLTQKTTCAFDVVVVNDSGKPLPAVAWQHDPRVTVLTTNRHERCVARNTGAAAAQGVYLHFLDDDDWMLAGGLHALYELAQTSEAAWLYGGTQLVDRDNNPLIELHHNMSGNIFTQAMTGEWIPLQSSLIRADVFFAAGGFDPAVVGGEDMDLLRRITLRSDVAETGAIISCLAMGEEESTTDYGKAWQRARRSKLQLLTEPHAFTRLRQSAPDAFWRGKIVRLYMMDFIECAKSANLGRALKRWGQAAYMVTVSSEKLVSTKFWRALFTKYTSESFLQGFLAANMAVKFRDVRPR